MESLADFTATSEDSTRERLKVMSVEYDTESVGVRVERPIVHLFCRDQYGEPREIKAVGFRPHFYIREADYKRTKYKHQISNDDRILDVHYANDDGQRYRSLSGEQLVQLECVVPQDVKTLRDTFHDEWGIETFEADLYFTDRFLISEGIHRGISVPKGKSKISVDEIEPLEEDQVPEIDPRVITVDIEVTVDDEFPDPMDANRRITAITAHDNYCDDYVVWVLAHESWSAEDRAEVHGIADEKDVQLALFDNETALLSQFIEYCIDRRPDLVSGWNSTGFDWPYILNRAKKLSIYEVEQLSPMGDVGVWDGFGGQPTPQIKGVIPFDLLEAYRKTQIHELRSYALDSVAEYELGEGKEDIGDIDAAWEDDPHLFVTYNIRDVEAVVEIERSQNILDLFDNLRRVTGAQYDDCNANINLIDILFLRRANDAATALPTSTEPNEDWYHGAIVLDPKAGLTENAVYPDLASLYPYSAITFNLSPETLIGDSEDLAESDYTEDDCYKAYVDYRPVKRCDPDDDWQQYTDGDYKAVQQEKEDGGMKTRWIDDPEEKPLYILRPDVKEGFVREAILSMVDLKYEYKGTEKYGAVKRITNSTYGVLGDSNSYGTGFRLFDWRLAEAITLVGRNVLKFTGDQFIDHLHKMGYEEAELIAGDTDSVVTSIPDADNLEEVRDVADKAAKMVDMDYDDLVVDKFNFRPEDKHWFEVELESVADSIFYPRDFSADDPELGVKKRYAQWIRWDEDDGWLPDDEGFSFKGFELVRSDTATITKTAQEEVLRMILTEDDPKDSVYDYLEDLVREVENGEIPLEQLGVPSAIGQDLSEYGSEDKRCQPKYRGAKYSNDQGIDDLGSGDKPLLFYIDRVPSEYDETYSTDTAEDDDPVDALTVSHPNRIPDGFEIDYEEHIEKALRGPLEPIVKTMGWRWSDIVNEGQQSSFAQFT